MSVSIPQMIAARRQLRFAKLQAKAARQEARHARRDTSQARSAARKVRAEISEERASQRLAKLEAESPETAEAVDDLEDLDEIEEGGHEPGNASVLGGCNHVPVFGAALNPSCPKCDSSSAVMTIGVLAAMYGGVWAWRAAR